MPEPLDPLAQRLFEFQAIAQRLRARAEPAAVLLDRRVVLLERAKGGRPFLRRREEHREIPRVLEPHLVALQRRARGGIVFVEKGLKIGFHGGSVTARWARATRKVRLPAPRAGWITLGSESEAILLLIIKVAAGDEPVLTGTRTPSVCARFIAAAVGRRRAAR